MKPKNKLFYMECHVAGRQYHEASDVWEKLNVGTELFLEFDKDNRYDPNAVAICYRDTADEEEYCLGYIPRSENEILAKFLEMDYANIFECRLSGKNDKAHYEKQLHVTIKIKRAVKLG